MICLMKRYNLILLLLLAISCLSAQNIRNHYQPASAGNRSATSAALGSRSAVSDKRQNGYQPFVNGTSDFGTQNAAPAGTGMRSTAAMSGSGSRYVPEVTEPGATGIESTSGSVRRKGFGGGGEGEPGEHHGEVYGDPIGSLPIAFMLLLSAAYCARKRE